MPPFDYSLICCLFVVVVCCCCLQVGGSWRWMSSLVGPRLRFCDIQSWTLKTTSSSQNSPVEKVRQLHALRHHWPPPPHPPPPPPPPPPPHPHHARALTRSPCWFDPTHPTPNPIYRFLRLLGEIYMTTKSYKAHKRDELSFGIGVNLQIVERNYAGWWWAV